ncbi:MAG: DUF3109 family protein [Bacteroidia bacterium]|nr:DUF3109 family protein [Bacteroidia bacterium]MDW8334219.1 DUF3109 family protein [Bacteroidia bacterium]
MKNQTPAYVLIRDVPVAADILTAEFCCRLSACKGACCVEGQGGAPLTAGEARYLQAVYPLLKDRMRPEAVEAVERFGPARRLDDGWETTLVGSAGPCVFAVFDPTGAARCALRLYGFESPVSCRLYPIREERRSSQVFLRYEKWAICRPARNHGGVPLIEFVRDALVERFGRQFYDELCAVRKAMLEALS